MWLTKRVRNSWNEASPSVRSGETVRVHEVALALALGLTFVAYSGTLGFGFVYDDHAQIVANPFVHSWRFAARYFTHHVWGGVQPELLGNYYRPFFLIWLRFNNMLFGDRPWAWHLSGIIAHLGVTLLVYFLALQIAGDRLTAAVAALIFGVHPAHAETVAWISGVTEPLVALLFISSFLCHLLRREKKGQARAWGAVSLFLFAAALLTKETAVVLPLLVFAYEWIFWPGEVTSGGQGARLRHAIHSAAPSLALVPLYLVARSIALRGLIHTVMPLPLLTVVLTWPALLWLDLKLLAWPVQLNPYYDIPYVTHPGFLNFILPLMGVVATGFLLWVWGRRPGDEARATARGLKPRAVGFASAWLVVSILPLLNLAIFPRDDFAHDRYMYLPSVGFALLTAMGLRTLQIGRSKLFGQPATQVVLAFGMTVSLAVATVFQSLIWVDDLVLYLRAVKQVPNNNFVRTDLANIAAGRGLYGVAVDLYRQTLARDPGFWPANYRLGSTYYRLGKFDEAEVYLDRAIALAPNRAEPFLFLGLTQLERGRLLDAEAALRQAIRIRPEAYGYHFFLGLALKRQGDLIGALKEFKSELAANPEHQAARDQVSEIEAGLRSPGSRRSPSRLRPSDSPRNKFMREGGPYGRSSRIVQPSRAPIFEPEESA